MNRYFAVHLARSAGVLACEFMGRLAQASTVSETLTQLAGEDARATVKAPHHVDARD